MLEKNYQEVLEDVYGDCQKYLMIMKTRPKMGKNKEKIVRIRPTNVKW